MLLKLGNATCFLTWTILQLSFFLAPTTYPPTQSQLPILQISCATYPHKYILFLGIFFFFNVLRAQQLESDSDTDSSEEGSKYSTRKQKRKSKQSLKQTRSSDSDNISDDDDAPTPVKCISEPKTLPCKFKFLR